MANEFKTAFVDGLFFAISVKTGVDASQSGIAISFINALKQAAPSSSLSNIITYSVYGITLIVTIVTIQSFLKDPITVGVGFFLGFLAGMA